MSLADLPMIDADEMERLLPWRVAIDALAEFLRAPAKPMPPRASYPCTSGELLVMPAESSTHLGVKLISLHHNAPSGFDRAQGVYVLFDSHTLAPVALTDAASLSTIRTTAVSALAADRLARSDARRLVVFGTGPQAVAHARAMATIRDLDDIAVIGRRPEAVDAACRGIAADGLSARPGNEADLREADLVACCTAAGEPLFDSQLLKDDVFVVAMGSHHPDRREVDEQLVRSSFVVVESRENALHEAGDIIMAAGADPVAGLIDATLSEVVSGAAAAPGGRVLFKSVGEGWEDLAVAAAAVARSAGLSSGGPVGERPGGLISNAGAVVRPAGPPSDAGAVDRLNSLHSEARAGDPSTRSDAPAARESGAPSNALITGVARLEIAGADEAAYRVLLGDALAADGVQVASSDSTGITLGSADPEQATKKLQRRGLTVGPQSVSVNGLEVGLAQLPTGGPGSDLPSVGSVPRTSAIDGTQAGSESAAYDVQLDHIVVHTADAERAIAAYGGRLGLDLRLERHAPQWGAHMLFFRCGSAVIEVVQPLGDKAHEGVDTVWGVAWRVADVAATAARLADGGVEVSEIRPGRKPGSQVCTITDERFGLPTLLISHATSPSPGE